MGLTRMIHCISFRSIEGTAADVETSGLIHRLMHLIPPGPISWILCCCLLSHVPTKTTLASLYWMLREYSKIVLSLYTIQPITWHGDTCKCQCTILIWILAIPDQATSSPFTIDNMTQFSLYKKRLPWQLIADQACNWEPVVRFYQTRGMPP